MIRELRRSSTKMHELVLGEVESDDEKEMIKKKKKKVVQPELSLGPSEHLLHHNLCNFIDHHSLSKPQVNMMINKKRKQIWDDDDQEDDIDLNVNHPLPVDWEQCLDLQSGKMYYLNRKTLSRSWSRPKNQNLDLELNISTLQSTSTAMNYYLDHHRPHDLPATGAAMIAAACNNCHLLVMLCKSSPTCPNCKFMHSVTAAATGTKPTPLETLCLLK